MAVRINDCHLVHFAESYLYGCKDNVNQTKYQIINDLFCAFADFYTCIDGEVGDADVALHLVAEQSEGYAPNLFQVLFDEGDTWTIHG